MAVSTIGENITELAGHLVEVDLQDNLFSRWDEIIQLASNLPLLNNLLLHGNKIGNITNEFIEEFNLNSRSSYSYSYSYSFFFFFFILSLFQMLL